jgi:predicted nucleic acid-binding protein
LTRAILLDAGPLVALLNRSDRQHTWAAEQVAGLRPPLLSCEAVLSEACFLLRRLDGGIDAVFRLLERGLIALGFRLADEAPAVRSLLARYRAVPMSLADACLVRLAELHAESVVLTLDADFRVYRKNGRQVIPTLMPGR